MTRPDDAKTRILDAAERLCQTRGYNGFSFRDLADDVGIRSASIHYHFPTKSDLGKAMIMRYRQTLETAMADIERREATAPGRINRFVTMLRSILANENRLCLCGILAAEAGTISDEMKEELRQSFELAERWLTRVLDGGVRKKELKFTGSPRVAARSIFAALEGAMIAARALGEEDRLEESADWVLSQLVPT